MGAAKPAQNTLDASTRLHFVDFSLRAWREGPYLQVIAHSTPAGGMRHPVAVKLGAFAQDDYRLPVDASLKKGAEVGRQLARLQLIRKRPGDLLTCDRVEVKRK